MEEIVDKRVERRSSRFGGDQVQYLIKWKGYGDDQNSWEPVEGLTHCLGVVEEY